MPKLQSDIGQSAQNERQAQKNIIKGSNKKPKKEHINTGHWTQEEHNTYLKFLSQYEDIMTSSMMKKTSKIFKQMSELIGSRTPSQCRSHHQKFNPYAIRGENGKRLPRNERSRAGRKRKNMSESSNVDKQILFCKGNQQIFPENQQFNQDVIQYYQNQVYIPPTNEVYNLQSLQDAAQPENVIFQQLQPEMQYEQIKIEEHQNEIDDLKQSIAYTFEAFFQSPNFNPRKVSVDQNLAFSLNDPNIKFNEVFQ